MGMKPKTIEKLLAKKIDAWIETIPEHGGLREMVAKNVIVTGGCIASMMLGEKINDYDIYLRTKEAAKALADHYVALFKANVNIACEMTVRDEDGRISIVVQSAGIASENKTGPYQYFETRPDDEGSAYIDQAAKIVNNSGQIEEAYQETEGKALATEDDGKPKYRPVFMSTNAITLSHGIQIVIRFYGEPDAIHENYDFAHCMNYWTSWDRKLVTRMEALTALLSRELRYVGSKYPVCSVMRLRKFIARGWTINAGQILKMIMQINDLDLTNVEVLRDQLTGVDSAYFVQVIERLKEKDPEKINAAYLIEIIDRMF